MWTCVLCPVFGSMDSGERLLSSYMWADFCWRSQEDSATKLPYRKAKYSMWKFSPRLPGHFKSRGCSLASFKMPIREGKFFRRQNYGTQQSELPGSSRIYASSSMWKWLRVAAALSGFQRTRLHQSPSSAGRFAPNEIDKGGAGEGIGLWKNSQEGRGFSGPNFKSGGWVTQLPDSSAKFRKAIKGIPLSSRIFAEAYRRWSRSGRWFMNELCSLVFSWLCFVPIERAYRRSDMFDLGTKPQNSLYVLNVQWAS